MNKVILIIPLVIFANVAYLIATIDLAFLALFKLVSEILPLSIQ